YTIPPHNEARRQSRYVTRHKANESWSEYTSVGALSRYILWEYSSLTTDINQYAKRFGLQIKKY
ncbi:MAG: hypothetical protein ACKPKO_23595, partial [Candidatus Fonsibacter sp.]